MPYGFILDSGRGTPLLEKTHDGKGEGSRVIAINGDSVLGKSRFDIREILNAQAQTQRSVEFLLESGDTITFHHDSAPNDWNEMQKTTA